MSRLLEPRANIKNDLSSDSKVDYEIVKNKVNELLQSIDPKQNVIFDWNGTLLDDLDHTLETANHFLSEQGLPQFERQSYRLHFNFPVKDCYQKLGYDFNKLSYEKMSDQFVERFMKGIERASLFDFVMPLLRTLNDLNKRVFILSASDQESLNHLIDRFRIRSLVEASYGIANRQAASKIYRGQELISDFSLNPTESVLIGDTLHDLEVARHLGMDAVLLDHGHHCTSRLIAEHDSVLKWHQL